MPLRQVPLCSEQSAQLEAAALFWNLSFGSLTSIPDKKSRLEFQCQPGPEGAMKPKGEAKAGSAAGKATGGTLSVENLRTIAKAR